MKNLKGIEESELRERIQKHFGTSGLKGNEIHTTIDTVVAFSHNEQGVLVHEILYNLRAKIEEFGAVLGGSPGLIKAVAWYRIKGYLSGFTEDYEDPNPSVGHSIDVNGNCNKGCC